MSILSTSFHGGIYELSIMQVVSIWEVKCQSSRGACIWSFCLFLFDGVECHFQQYFSYIVAVSFIGG